MNCCYNCPKRKAHCHTSCEEYKKFSDVMMDKPLSYYAFQMLYWCGIREGELLALTPQDFDFEAEFTHLKEELQSQMQEEAELNKRILNNLTLIGK